MAKKQNNSLIMDKVPEPDPDAMARASLKRIKNKILVMSGKGGVGKTSVSVNLSIALAEKGFKVGLMDVDIHGPDIPRMLGLKGMLVVNESRKLQPLKFSENLSAVSIESLLSEKDDAIIWRGPVKHSAIRQFIGEAEWGDLDYLIIDCPPGTGDEPLTVAQLIKDARAVIVTTPQKVALADVRKSINFCKTLKMDILGIIENMSGYVCPHCGETSNIFGSGGGEETASLLNLKFLGKIPMDPNMVKCGDEGISFQRKYADSPATKVFGDIAAQIEQLSHNEFPDNVKCA
ncbi:MAG: Mrp/NBP35 family ATP-binding protein [Desulfobacterales bacterium]|nr:Mrp/NBP35 family ATP-binding protein [Desulfobacterales bacterium]